MSPVAINGVDKQGVAVNGVQVKQALSAANSTVNKGVYDATLLESVDPDLAAANILQPVEIFGKVGTVVPGVDVSDADALVTDVKDPKTFYSVAAPRKTGTMPTVAIVAANDDYPAGYHAGDAGGLDAIDLDLAPANIKSGVTIFGKLGTYTQNATHDIEDGAVNAGTTGTITQAVYYNFPSVGISSDLDLASLTQAYSANSLAEAYGHALLRANTANTLKLRLYMDGVQVTEGAFIQNTVFYTLEVINGNKALLGNKIVKISVHNWDAGAARFIYICGTSTLGGRPTAAGVFCGSVKVV